MLNSKESPQPSEQWLIMRCLVPTQRPKREYWTTPHLQWPCFIYSRPLPAFPHPCLLISRPNTSSIPHGNIVPSSAQLSQVAGTPNDVCFVFRFYFIILSFTRLRYGVQLSPNACSWKYHIFQWQAPLLGLVYHAKRLTLGDFSLRNVRFVSSAQPSPSVTTVEVWISTAKNVQILSQGAPGHQSNQMARCQFCHTSILRQLGGFPSRAQGGTLGGEWRAPWAKELESWCWHIPNLPTKWWRNSW